MLRHLALVIAGEIDGVQLGASRGTRRVPEEHQHTTIRRPSWPLVVEALRQDPLTRSVRLHHPDQKLAAEQLGESDKIAARRPHWRRIAPLPLADAMLVAAV